MSCALSIISSLFLNSFLFLLLSIFFLFSFSYLSLIFTVIYRHCHYLDTIVGSSSAPSSGSFRVPGAPPVYRAQIWVRVCVLVCFCLCVCVCVCGFLLIEYALLIPLLPLLIPLLPLLPSLLPLPLSTSSAPQSADDEMFFTFDFEHQHIFFKKELVDLVNICGNCFQEVNRAAASNGKWVRPSMKWTLSNFNVFLF